MASTSAKEQPGQTAQREEVAKATSRGSERRDSATAQTKPRRPDSRMPGSKGETAGVVVPRTQPQTAAAKPAQEQPGRNTAGATDTKLRTHTQSGGEAGAATS